MTFVVEEPQARIQETLRLIEQMESLQTHEESRIAREQGIQFPLPRELSCAVGVPSSLSPSINVTVTDFTQDSCLTGLKESVAILIAELEELQVYTYAAHAIYQC